MLTLGPLLVSREWKVTLREPGLSSSFSSSRGWKNYCCCLRVRVWMLREWFKFRPTTAGQTVVLRTSARTPQKRRRRFTRVPSCGLVCLLDVVAVVDGMM